MTVIRFPTSFGGKQEPPTLYVCAPSREDLLVAQRKFGLGHSREAATTQFFAGGANLGIEARTFKIDKAPKWVRHQVVSQLLLFVARNQPLGPLDDEALTVLGLDAYAYGDGPVSRRPRRRR